LPKADATAGLRLGWATKRLVQGRAMGLALMAACLLALVAPVFALALIVFFVFSGARRASAGILATGVFVAGFFGWMNTQKLVMGDWVWYTEHYNLLQRLGLFDYLGHRIGPVQIKWSEPVYYSGAYALSRITHGNVPALAVAVTVGIYLPLTFGIKILLARSTLRPIECNFVVLLTLLGGVTFTLTTHLVRQEIASAFMALAILQYIYGRRKLGILWATIAILTHNSSLVPLAACVVAVLFVAPSGKILRTRFVVACGAFAGVGFLAAGLLSTQGYDAVNDGSVSLLVFAADALLLLVFILLRGSMSWLGPLHAFLVAAVSLHLTFVLSVAYEPVPFLRMYFYMEVFRAIMIGAIIATLIRRESLAVVAVPALGLMLVYCELRITRSPFVYGGGGILEHLFAPLLLN
jgi:hypothetical protein